MSVIPKDVEEFNEIDSDSFEVVVDEDADSWGDEDNNANENTENDLNAENLDSPNQIFHCAADDELSGSAKSDPTKVLSELNEFNVNELPPGFERWVMEEDGNCLFRSLASSILTGPNDHQAVREGVVEYMLNHSDDFNSFVDDLNFDDYISDISQNGEWGDNLVLKALGEIFIQEITIHIWDSNRHAWIEQTFGHGRRHIYWEYQNNVHYNVLRETDSVFNEDSEQSQNQFNGVPNEYLNIKEPIRHREEDDWDVISLVSLEAASECSFKEVAEQVIENCPHNFIGTPDFVPQIKETPAMTGEMFCESDGEYDILSSGSFLDEVHEIILNAVKDETYVIDPEVKINHICDIIYDFFPPDENLCEVEPVSPENKKKKNAEIQDVKVGIVLFAGNGCQVALEEKHDAEYELIVPQGYLREHERPLVGALRVFTEQTGCTNLDAFAILNHVVERRENDCLILLFPALVGRRLLFLKEDPVQFFPTQHVATSILPALRSIVNQAFNLLMTYHLELPTLVDNETAEKADYATYEIMVHVEEHERKVNAKEVKDFLCRNEDDLERVLGGDMDGKDKDTLLRKLIRQSMLEQFENRQHSNVSFNNKNIPVVPKQNEHDFQESPATKWGYRHGGGNFAYPDHVNVALNKGENITYRALNQEYYEVNFAGKFQRNTKTGVRRPVEQLDAPSQQVSPPVFPNIVSRKKAASPVVQNTQDVTMEMKANLLRVMNSEEIYAQPPPQAKYRIPGGRNEHEALPEDQMGPWICTKCTISNAPEHNVCQLCFFKPDESA